MIVSIVVIYILCILIAVIYVSPSCKIFINFHQQKIHSMGIVVRKKKGNAVHIISAHDKLLHAQKLVFLYPLNVRFL